jgi:hypothetical protein
MERPPPKTLLGLLPTSLLIELSYFDTMNLMALFVERNLNGLIATGCIKAVPKGTIPEVYSVSYTENFLVWFRCELLAPPHEGPEKMYSPCFRRLMSVIGDLL